MESIGELGIVAHHTNEETDRYFPICLASYLEFATYLNRCWKILVDNGTNNSADVDQKPIGAQSPCARLALSGNGDSTRLEAN